MKRCHSGRREALTEKLCRAAIHYGETTAHAKCALRACAAAGAGIPRGCWSLVLGDEGSWGLLLGAQKSIPYGREMVASPEMPPLSFWLLCGCCCGRGVLPRFFLALGNRSSRAPLCSALPALVGSPALHLKPA